MTQVTITDGIKLQRANVCSNLEPFRRLILEDPSLPEQSFETYIPEAVIKQVGEDYVKSHTSIDFRNYDNAFIATLLMDDFYNDKPIKQVQLHYLGYSAFKNGDVFEGINDKKIYVRIQAKTLFVRLARWVIYPDYDSFLQYQYKAYEMPEPKTQFLYGLQQEMVTWHELYGVAAYPDTYCPNFTAYVYAKTRPPHGEIKTKLLLKNIPYEPEIFTNIPENPTNFLDKPDIAAARFEADIM